VEWDDVIQGFTEPEPEWTFEPHADAVRTYEELKRTYAATEKHLLVST
jgi:hypothetical protein